ncbi:TonB-dependent receptor [Cesiribacter andamanensis]|uniref:Colicin I receptor n=1 Tax=Cesiribacter andamanensis AMV16 TaxID=1279009 RepID=M7MX41_9BACT|nr:TonB-dependent receptor [Cesiribacter andamanensis]EMR00998.1 Colicin I receptor precursor [Cesiribacter andamanensis AMV16]
MAGRVTSGTLEALMGVAVVLKPGMNGVVTDLNGRFELRDIPPGSYVLQISYLGFETQELNLELQAGDKKTVSCTLSEQADLLQAVEISGKSLSQEVREQAYTVTAITAKDLYNSTSDAKELLNRVAGVRIMEEGGLGSALNVTLNGFSGDQVKFFLDGIPMDNFGSSLSVNNLPVNSIERIEIYKGVVPIWLGTDALGGAVNIITNQQHNFLDASYAIGSFNTHRLSLNGAYTAPKSGFTLRSNLAYNYSDNNYRVWVPIRQDNRIVDSAEVERFHDRYRSGLLKLETGWVNRRWADNFLLGLLASGNDQQVQTGSTMNSVYGGITQNSQSLIPSLRWSKENLLTKGLHASLYTAYNSTKSQVIDTLRGVTYNWLGEATYTPGSNNGELSRTFTTLTDSELNSQLNLRYVLSPRHSLALNHSYSYFQREVFDTENPDRIENKFPKTLNKQVLGLAYTFDPSKKWSTTLFAKYFLLQAATSKEVDFGLSSRRIEGQSVQKDNFGYGLATSYFVRPSLQLKASYEHTSRMPWAAELFGNGLFILPNPDLGPEQSHNLNLGAAYTLKLRHHHQLSLESSFIYRESKDLIYQVVRVASPETSSSNLSETRTLGVEGSLLYQWRDRLRLGGNMTFQDITDQAEFIYNQSYTNTGYQRNYQLGYRLPNTPYLFGNAHAGLSFQDVGARESALQLTYHFSFVEQYFLSWAALGSRDTKKIIPRQTAHALELAYSLQQGKYNLALECRNLLDARLYDKYYLQKPGRAFYLKLRWVL